MWSMWLYHNENFGSVKCTVKGMKELFCSSAGERFRVVTAVAQVPAVVWVWPLAQELPHDMGVAQKDQKKKKKKKKY